MENNGWLIYSEVDARINKAYIDWFIEEANKQGLGLKLILREQLQVGIINQKPIAWIDHQAVAIPSFAIVRTVEPLLNLQLEQMGIAVFNSSHVASICNHKGRTHTEMNKLQIPMVDTFFLKRKNATSNPMFTFPFVVKDANGRGGKQVFYIKNQQDWEKCIEDDKLHDMVIQSSNVQLGKDLRVFIVGKEIVGAVLRESNVDFRANFKLGGTAKWYELTDVEIRMIEKIVNNFDFGMVGIDFLISHDGSLLFNEIEDVVGSRTLSSVSETNILKKYITHIKHY